MSSEIEILGKKYAIRSDADEAFMVETADLVNSKMREIMGKSQTLGPEKVAVITAMNLAGELLQLKRDHDGLKSTVRTKSKNILNLIESQL